MTDVRFAFFIVLTFLMQIKYILHQGMPSVVFLEENKLIETALILNSDFLSTRRHDISAPMKSVPLISLFRSLLLHHNIGLT